MAIRDEYIDALIATGQAVGESSLPPMATVGDMLVADLARPTEITRSGTLWIADSERALMMAGPIALGDLLKVDRLEVAGTVDYSSLQHFLRVWVQWLKRKKRFKPEWLTEPLSEYYSEMAICREWEDVLAEMTSYSCSEELGWSDDCIGEVEYGYIVWPLYFYDALEDAAIAAEILDMIWLYKNNLMAYNDFSLSYVVMMIGEEELPEDEQREMIQRVSGKMLDLIDNGKYKKKLPRIWAEAIAARLQYDKSFCYSSEYDGEEAQAIDSIADIDLILKRLPKIYKLNYGLSDLFHACRNDSGAVWKELTECLNS